MNGYDKARSVEARAMAVLLPYLDETADGRVVLTAKGTLSKWLQESVGDVVMSISDRMWTVEIKAEERHTGNVFLETWSNKNLNSKFSHAERGSNPGWLMKLRSDLLLYYFIDKGILYTFDLFQLKRWAYGYADDAGNPIQGRLTRFPEKRQSKYDQLNDTWGAVVSLQVLHDQLPQGAMKFTNVRQRELMSAA